ncbi:hypothetical protein ACFFLM_24535 [Deinococcus oregonensis]|uniref:Proteinase inhibitor I42 chagasin domain-containing protein n=1 Tax=Deinococcus oregonensis TaxID=1805970 RepID=A0ABV6B797_9DEIO
MAPCSLPALIRGRPAYHGVFLSLLLLTALSCRVQAFGGSSAPRSTTSIHSQAVQIELDQEEQTISLWPGDTLSVRLFEDTLESPLSWSSWLAPTPGQAAALTLVHSERESQGDHGWASLRYDVTYTFRVESTPNTTAQLLFVQSSASGLDEQSRRAFPDVLRWLTVKIVR